MRTPSGGPADQRHLMFARPANIGLATLLVSCMGLAAFSASAQSYPAKPVRLIAASAAGMVDDLVGRIVAQELTKTLGQQVIIDNRPGAGGAIGQDFVAKSLPDGYTLLLGGGSMTGAQYVKANLPFNVLRDFAPVSLLVTVQLCLLVNPTLPARNVKEFIALARAQPGKLNFGSGGVGQTPYFATAYFNLEAGIKTVHVAYKSSAAALTDVVAGQIDFIFAGTPVAAVQTESGKLRALGVTGSKRSPALPDVPTIAEAALPGFDMTSWLSILAPAATPRTVIDTLNSATVRVIALPEVRERLSKGGLEPESSTPEELTKRMVESMEKYRRIAKHAGLKPE